MEDNKRLSAKADFFTNHKNIKSLRFHKEKIKKRKFNLKACEPS